MIKAPAMTAITFSSDKPKSASSPWRFVVAVLRSLHQARQQRVVSNELAAMSDRELDDLGLIRADIPAVARGELRR
jgi:uncharacterized protein YjiS (DUF1127 family)